MKLKVLKVLLILQVILLNALKNTLFSQLPPPLNQFNSVGLSAACKM